MMEANPGVARCHGVALWSQQSKQGPKEGKRSRIPTGTHNGRDFMVNGQSVNRLAMSMKVISMKHGGFDDRDPMLKTIARSTQDLRHWHTNERSLHILNLRYMRDDRNLAERLRQRLGKTIRASDDRRQHKILAGEQNFRTDLSHPSKTHNN